MPKVMGGECLPQRAADRTHSRPFLRALLAETAQLEVDALLERNLGDVRRELSLEQEPANTTAGDVALARLWGALGLVLGTLLFLLFLPLAPIGYLAGKLARK